MQCAWLSNDKVIYADPILLNNTEITYHICNLQSHTHSPRATTQQGMHDFIWGGQEICGLSKCSFLYAWEDFK